MQVQQFYSTNNYARQQSFKSRFEENNDYKFFRGSLPPDDRRMLDGYVMILEKLGTDDVFYQKHHDCGYDRIDRVSEKDFISTDVDNPLNVFAHGEGLEAFNLAARMCITADEWNKTNRYTEADKLFVRTGVGFPSGYGPDGDNEPNEDNEPDDMGPSSDTVMPDNEGDAESVPYRPFVPHSDPQRDADDVEANKGSRVDKTNEVKKSHQAKGPSKNITFADIGGQDKAIDTIRKKILFPLKYPEAYKNKALKHGFLLYGEPGTGKSLLAEALANECGEGTTFIKLNGLEMESKYVGESESNWRSLFKSARQSQPCIIFIDEFDAIAKKRGGQDVYGDKVLNQILTLISDVEKKQEKIYIIAATNRLEALDSAVTRPGRLGDSIIRVTLPEKVEDTEQIFDINVRNKKILLGDCDKTKTMQELFKLKASGAEISKLVDDSYEYAMERNCIYEKMANGTYKPSDTDNLRVDQVDFDRAIEELKKGKDLGDDRKKAGFIQD